MLVNPEVAGDSNQLVVLGRGIEIQDDQAVLGQGSIERADRAAEYYREHRDVFEIEDSVIVATGGAPRLSDQDFGTASEASLMADRMMRADVPHQLIETETASRSTLGNLVNTRRLGYLTLEAVDVSHPLGIVSHAGHLRRAVDVAHKVLGHQAALSGIITPGEAGLRSRMQERAMRQLWRATLAGVPDGDLDTLLAREAQLTTFATTLRRPLRAIIK